MDRTQRLVALGWVALVPALAACGDRSALLEWGSPSATVGGGAPSADGFDAGGATANAPAEQTPQTSAPDAGAWDTGGPVEERVDAGGTHVGPGTSAPDARFDAPALCSTLDAGPYCLPDRVIRIPYPAACGLPSRSLCDSLCPPGTEQCVLEADAGANAIVCYCPSGIQ